MKLTLVYPAQECFSPSSQKKAGFGQMEMEDHADILCRNLSHPHGTKDYKGKAVNYYRCRFPDT